jgi:hypothetical protein
MYRHRQLITVSDIDAWNECVAITEEANKLCASKVLGGERLDARDLHWRSEDDNRPEGLAARR